VDGVRLARVLDTHVLALRPQVPLELAIGVFQKMVCALCRVVDVC
jgi:hypothetical protein